MTKVQNRSSQYKLEQHVARTLCCKNVFFVF